MLYQLCELVYSAVGAVVGGVVGGAVGTIYWCGVLADVS